MTNRSRTEIASQILDSAGRSSDDNDDGVTKTKIMHKVFLTSAQLKEYLMMLTENDLLGYDSATRKFKTTQKGHRFLELQQHEWCDGGRNQQKQQSRHMTERM